MNIEVLLVWTLVGLMTLYIIDNKFNLNIF